jgi:predicted transcriptional regulator YdeE
VAATNHEEAPEKPKGLDQAEVAYQEWQAFDSRAKGNWRALPARESYQESFGQRVCRYYQSQAESYQGWQASRQATQEDCQEDSEV